MTTACEFKIGDKAVYPAHGVGEITDIQIRKLGGQERHFYILKMIENGMKIMVPVSTASTTGMRSVVSAKEARDILKILKADEVAVTTQPWNRRYREYMEMLKSGSPVEIARVLRDLSRIRTEKELSFGERRLLDTANTLLIAEIAIALGKTEEQMKKQVETLFS